MNRLQKGFTLIELMIVVAIVGILAAIAIPAYKDYIARSKVSECAATMGACKTSITEYFNTRNVFPADVSAAGCSESESQYCAGITAVDQAANSFTGAVKVSIWESGSTAECDLVLTATSAGGEITGWTGTTTCPSKYVPAQFRP